MIHNAGPLNNRVSLSRSLKGLATSKLFADRLFLLGLNEFSNLGSMLFSSGARCKIASKNSTIFRLGGGGLLHKKVILHQSKSVL